MKPAIAAIAGLGLVGLAVGLWTGKLFQGAHTSASSVGRVAVPGGETGALNRGNGIADTSGDGDGEAIEAGPRAVAKIPPRLPDFTLHDRNGKATPVATWAGKSLVLNFWATWCAPCRREIPLLKALSGEWAGRGVTVVGIAVDHRDKVARYADELKIPYPILVGEEDALDLAVKFGVDSPVFPFSVFTDRRGRVVTLYVGELHRRQADLILAAVQNVNEEHIGLDEAQREIVAGLHALPDEAPEAPG